MTEERFYSKLIDEIHDLNAYFKTLTTTLARIEKILNRTPQPPVNHEVSDKEDRINDD